MPCECTIAGFCTRHGVSKSAQWVALCQTRADYRNLWNAGRGPGQPIDPAKAKEQGEANEQRINLFHELWLAIHTKQNPTPAWFEAWCSLVPNAGCSCEDWLRNYIAVNPPQYDDWPRYTWTLHNAVTAKVHPERQPFSWNAFLVIYPQ